MGHYLRLRYGIPLHILPIEYAKNLYDRDEDELEELSLALEMTVEEYDETTAFLCFINQPELDWFEVVAETDLSVNKLKNLPEVNYDKQWEVIEEKEPRLLEYKHLFGWYIYVEFC